MFCNPRRNINLPSWLFNVEDPHDAGMRYSLGRDYVKFSASGSKVADVLANLKDISILDFKITRIGTLSRLAPVSVDEVLQENLDQQREHEFSVGFRFTPLHVFEMMHTIWRTAVDAEDRVTIADGPGLERLLRAFMCDIAPDGQRLPVTIGELELENFKSLIDGSKEVTEQFADDIHEYFRPTLMRVFGMRFCVYSTPVGNDIEDDAPLSSLLCWTPKEVEVGDLLAVIHGFSLPMLMREVAGLDRYRFLGICYIHDFMDGGALERGDFNTEYVTVC
jgi:hypothetical protein